MSIVGIKLYALIVITVDYLNIFFYKSIGANDAEKSSYL